MQKIREVIFSIQTILELLIVKKLKKILNDDYSEVVLQPLWMESNLQID